MLASTERDQDEVTQDTTDDSTSTDPESLSWTRSFSASIDSLSSSVLRGAS